MKHHTLDNGTINLPSLEVNEFKNYIINIIYIKIINLEKNACFSSKL